MALPKDRKRKSEEGQDSSFLKKVKANVDFNNSLANQHSPSLQIPGLHSPYGKLETSVNKSPQAGNSESSERPYLHSPYQNPGALESHATQTQIANSPRDATKLSHSLSRINLTIPDSDGSDGDFSDASATTRITPVAGTNTPHTSLEPELPPLSILLEELKKAARTGLATPDANVPHLDENSKSKAACNGNTPSFDARSYLPPDIWALPVEEKEEKEQVEIPTAISKAPVRPTSRRPSVHFAAPRPPPKPKAKRGAKGAKDSKEVEGVQETKGVKGIKGAKVDILPSAEEKERTEAARFCNNSNSPYPAITWQQLPSLEAKLREKGYDEEKAGEYAVIMRLLGINVGELERQVKEDDLEEDIPEILEVE